MPYYIVNASERLEDGKKIIVKRKMTVIDGQPYYQSTGKNSGLPNVWLPFIMVIGSEVILYDKLSAAIYNKKSLKETIEDAGNFNYIIKFEAAHLAKKYIDLPIDNNKVKSQRLPTKATLITSLRLSNKLNLMESIELTEDEIALAKQKINLELDSTVKNPEISDADEINAWLCKQGATAVRTVLSQTTYRPTLNSSNFFEKKVTVSVPCVESKQSTVKKNLV